MATGFIAVADVGTRIRRAPCLSSYRCLSTILSTGSRMNDTAVAISLGGSRSSSVAPCQDSCADTRFGCTEKTTRVRRGLQTAAGTHSRFTVSSGLAATSLTPTVTCCISRGTGRYGVGCDDERVAALL